MSTVEPTQVATERPLQRLPRGLENHSGFTAAIEALAQRGRVTFDGVVGSSAALLTASLLRHAPATVVLVLASQEAVDRVVGDLELFAAGRPLRFPAWETGPDERRIDDAIYGERVRTLKTLAAATSRAEPGHRLLERLVVTSFPSLMQPVPDRDTLRAGTRWLAVGQQLDLDELRRWLAEQGFQATTAVQMPGEFSLRGGILDLFAPDWEQPVRVELLGDQIESLRCFNVETQRSQASLQQAEITVLRPRSAVSEHLATHLDPRTWFLLVEPEQIEVEARAIHERLPAGHDGYTPAQVHQALATFPVATAAAVATGYDTTVCRLGIESIERFSGEIGRVRDELDRAADGHEVFLIARTDADRQRLIEICAATRLRAEQRLQIVVGHLQAGFRLVPEQVILVSEADLFHRSELPRMGRRHLGRAIDSFLDLTDGDLVVHLSHGIARYRGLRMIRKQNHAEEHLELEFHGSTRIYVPATKIDLVQKYVGGTKSRPQLARIGSKTWVRQKKAAESAVTDLAAEMLELQAARRSRPGIAFAPDSDWQREFDASFPYTETADQLAAIEATKQDMLTQRPMDRLLCGDVGFGKTEVAMRTAFKAVDSGFQVAVLVPTTILAEQHFNTFRERMAEFPFDIARLSRFCTARQQREILDRLGRGQIDIVIGTHRLVSQDVRFQNLGLVIIDEEQRFGVEVKERLKQLRSTVDVMTMTATPIPRTLHMSLVGVRDISNLEIAPEDRLAVETQVTRFSATLIRHAILRELNRGGQVFFVHNRVQDIENVGQRLQEIVPEATIRIGHGQMPETELEMVMVDFVAHEFDVLLATTIVESGLDIPNANTIFIDQADRYGLADLHQLRGRVGRYKHQAYCYLLVDPNRHITPNAARRLRAIEEFSDMGAGFAIAMRDLEIRGAGNLLGTQQSGHIATVGYELYCQLLETAVRRLKRLPPRESLDVDVQLPGEAYLPSAYVPDLRSKVDLYRRLARVTRRSDLADLRQEMEDRFGPVPEPVERLLELVALKIDAAYWQIAAIQTEDRYVVFRYGNRRRIEQLAARMPRQLRIVDHQSAYLPATPAIVESPEVLQLVKSVLRPDD